MRNVSLLALSASLCLAASGAYAQTCVATAGNTPLTGANSGQTLMGVNTCSATDQLAVACNGLSPIGSSPDLVWQVTIGPGASSGTITVTPTGASWNPYLILMSGACSGGSTCVIDADDNGPGVAESGNVPAAAGGYWLMITDESGLTTCGTADVTLGTLPVSLQSFSVE
jgi:hypothetical protein